MTETEILKQQLDALKAEAETLLAENKVQEAENKTVEIKMLKAKIEVQEKLDEANATIDNLNKDILDKDAKISTLTSDLETSKNEKDSAIAKFNDATDTITELSARVNEMQPIVDKFNEEERIKKLNNAINEYKSKFEKVYGSELFVTDEIQNLITETINNDKEISNKAKYALSDKLFELIDKQDFSGISVKDIQEPAKGTKNLNPEADEFEAVYGFKK